MSTTDSGGSREALGVHIEDIDKVTVELITLKCAGDCADVEAVARGGHPPYQLDWEDGSSEPKRTICLDSDASMSVSVTDTGIEADEFSYEQQRASARLTVDVLRCEDAGPPDDDACFVRNPSFEGSPIVGLGDLGDALPDWTVCNATPDVNPLFSSSPPTDGATYLGVVAGSADPLVESAGGTLCTPLQAGEPVSFSVDIAVSSYIGGAGKLELWGGASVCDKAELFWSSPTLSEVDAWQSFCVTLEPTRALTHIVAWPVADSLGGAYVLVDNFRLEPSCD